MSVIDKNGKLFGKVSVIDVSIVLIILFVIPLFIFGYKAMNDKKDKHERWVNIELRAQRVDQELIRVMNSGDMEIGDFGKKIGTFTKILNITPSATLTLSSDASRFISVNDPSKKDITLMLVLLCRDKSGFLYYKDYPVKIGNTITFSTPMYDITGIITSIKFS